MEYVAIYIYRNAHSNAYFGAVTPVLPFDRRDRIVVWRAQMPVGKTRRELDSLRAAVHNVVESLVDRVIGTSEIPTRLTSERGFVDPVLLI